MNENMKSKLYLLSFTEICRKKLEGKTGGKILYFKNPLNSEANYQVLNLLQSFLSKLNRIESRKYIFFSHLSI